MEITVKVDEQGKRAQPLFFMPRPPLYFQSFIGIPQLLEGIIPHSSHKVQYSSLTLEPHGQGSYMLSAKFSGTGHAGRPNCTPLFLAARIPSACR